MRCAALSTGPLSGASRTVALPMAGRDNEKVWQIGTVEATRQQNIPSFLLSVRLVSFGEDVMPELAVAADAAAMM